eukprot:c3683_g1_i1.p1 GENE.c3683_g1_i1~~c3683_g1_i1.p1  ORF type:complete len:180 (-),score=44.73 c3683_g1_i1:91-630(-)
MCPSGLELLKKNHVTCATIPSHTSHILQPLDVDVNLAFKTTFALLKSKYVSNMGTMPTPELRKQLLLLAAKALHDTLYEPTIVRAWERSGLFPWSPERIMNDPDKVNQTPADAGTQVQGRGGCVLGTVITSDQAIRKVKDVKEKANLRAKNKKGEGGEPPKIKEENPPKRAKQGAKSKK